MRILVVGAGATGGAFGARLQEAGRDVTYLVRPQRAAQLRAHGLTFVAPDGTRTLPVRAVTAAELADPFDIVIIAVKSGGLPAILDDITPAVGEGTVVIPFLNGLAHVDQLRERYGDRVLGGLVRIVATLRDGQVVQMHPLATMTIGALEASSLPRLAAVLDVLDVPGYELIPSDDVLGALWEKWAFIVAAGVVTCLLRNTVGNIVAAGGEPQVCAAIEEMEQVAAAAGHPVGSTAHEQSVGLLTQPGSAFTSSLYRDVIAGNPNETEHLLGDFAARARALAVPVPTLDLTLVQLRADALG
ncbi:2-dehydropantoate 2-reductase [Pengzhenrongella sp.]|jgi:2-dehydropantoate 2-reductase|uniref:2-dehydropantoate 2-reductase n=1 Tax=Pengzhenrongella sp. TaxID=2888820 RepID=UPI002F92AFF0